MAVGLRIPLQTVPPEPKKRDRSVFLYQGPLGDDPDEFAQCATCERWTGPKSQRCAILGKTLKVDEDDSCNLYQFGTPHEQEVKVSITPEDAGFVDRKVRCENCVSFKAPSTCLFLKSLNDALPELFDLDEEVEKHGCCSAQKPRESATRTKA